MDLNQFIENFSSQFEDSDIKNINESVDFKQLETWDSLTAFSVQMMIEDEYHVKVTPEEFKGISTVLDLYNLVKLKSI